MTHVTEIMPSNMPQWMWDAIDEGLLARRAMERVAKLEEQPKLIETVLDYFAVILCSLLLLGTGLVTGFLYSIMK